MAKWINRDLRELEAFIDDLVDYGYTLAVIEEGCLGVGRRMLISPDTQHYNILIREVPLNEWSSVNQTMKVRRIPKSWAEAYDKACA